MTWPLTLAFGALALCLIAAGGVVGLVVGCIVTGLSEEARP